MRSSNPNLNPGRLRPSRNDDEERYHELHHRRRTDVLWQARRLVLARSHEQGGRACDCRCRAEAVRDRRHSLRLLDGLAAHHAGDGVRRAFRHSAILRARRAGRRRHRARHDHAGASSGRCRRRKACAGGRRRKPSHRAEPRRLDPGAGAGRPSRLRGDAGADDPGLLRPRRLALHARIWRDPGRPRRIRGADARPRLDPSRRAVPRTDHRRRRDGLKAGGDAAETAGLLPGVRRRRGVRGQPRADLRDRHSRARLRAGAYPSARHGGARLERTRRRDCGCQGKEPRPASRYRMCAMPRSTTASPSRWRCCWKTSALPGAARRRRGCGQGISAATAPCRSTPMAGS